MARPVWQDLLELENEQNPNQSMMAPPPTMAMNTPPPRPQPPMEGIDPRVMEYLQRRRQAEAPNNQLYAAMGEAAAAAGTLGGRKADTSSLRNWANKADASNQRFQAEGDARQAKIANYLAQVSGKNRAHEQKLAQLKEQREYDEGRYNLAREHKKEDYNKQLALRGKQQQPATSSKVQQKMDEKYLDDYLEFVATGKEGAAQAMNKLEGYLNFLEKQKGAFVQAGGGPLTGTLMPDFMRTEDSIKLRDDIEGVAMQGLKDIFTGAISNEERRALAATFYNDKLSPDANIPIIKRKLEGMRRAYQNKLNRAKYFDENKTLAGYKGLSPADELESIRGKDPTFKPPKTPTPPNTAFAKQYKEGDKAMGPDGKMKIKRGMFWVPLEGGQ